MKNAGLTNRSKRAMEVAAAVAPPGGVSGVGATLGERPVRGICPVGADLCVRPSIVRINNRTEIKANKKQAWSLTP